MSSVLELAEGLMHRAQTIPGLRCYAYVPPKPEPPGMYVRGPIRWTYDETMGGEGERQWRPVFECWVVVNPADLHGAQRELQAYMAPNGERSLPAAIYGDPTLGDKAHDTKVLGGIGPVTVTDDAGGQLLGFALEVEVTAV